MRQIDCGNSFWRGAKESLRSATTFRCWLAKFGCDEPLRFEAIKSGVNRADRDFASSAGFDFLTDCHTVGMIFETQKTEYDDVFELTKIIAAWH